MIAWIKKAFQPRELSEYRMNHPEIVANLLISDLSQELGPSQLDAWLQTRIKRFNSENSWENKERQLPSLYLSIEKALLEGDDSKFQDISEIRKKVREKYFELLSIEAFGLIFRQQEIQNISLGKKLLAHVIDRALLESNLGIADRSLMEECRRWLSYLPHNCQLPLPFGMELKDAMDNKEVLKTINRVSNRLFFLISRSNSEEKTEEIFDQSYRKVAVVYKDLESFPIVFSLLPESLLKRERIEELSRSQVQEVLQSKIENLEQVNKELNQEIEHRNRFAKRLRESEEILSALINSSMDAVMAMNQRGIITAWNRQAEEILGWKDSEVIGHSIGKTIMPSQDREAHISWFRNYLKTGKSGFVNKRFETKCQNKSGESFDAEVSLAPFEKDGRRMYSIFIRDIRDRKKYEETLRKAKDEAENAARAKSEFLAVMSHEIRTPLNGVLGMTELLNETTLTKEQREYTELISTSGNNLLSIINDVLDFSKIEAGKMKFELRPFELEQNMLHSMEVFAARALEKSIDLHFDFDDNIPSHFIGDSNRFNQILINLISNAVKFTQGGEINLSARLVEKKKEEVAFEICVEDSGKGIDSENLKTIFEAFTQEDRSVSRKFGGTGLGLTICAKLVKMAGGKIWVESEVGKGSKFYVSFQGKYEDHHLPIQSANRKIIGFIKNDKARLLFNKYLKSLGATGKIFGDFESFKSALNENDDSDIILLDSKIPLDQMESAHQICIAFQKPITFVHHRGRNIPEELILSEVKHNKLSIPFSKRSINLKINEFYESKEDTKDDFDLEKIQLGKKIPLNIMVAEDNIINQTLIHTILQKMGYEIDMVSNGLEAIQRCKRKHYDLIFMDIQMPVMDGMEATKLILEEMNQDQPTHIIALTANASNEDRMICLNSGMKGFISKPFNISEISGVIQKFPNFECSLD